MTRIIKRRGKQNYEIFSRDKLIKSIIAASNSVREAEGSAQVTAQAVADEVESWLTARPEVTSDDIRRVAARALEKHNPDAAYYYTQHKHII